MMMSRMYSDMLDRHVQNLVNERQYKIVRSLLDDNQSLESVVNHELSKTREKLRSLLSSLSAICKTQSYSVPKTRKSWLEFYIQAMQGNLVSSTALDEILDSTKKLPSDTMDRLLGDLVCDELLPQHLSKEIRILKKDLLQLTTNLSDSALPLKSTYDINRCTLRTTVVAQKVSLSTNSAKLSSDDTAYTIIVDLVIDTLSDYFQHTLVNPSDLFLHEVFVYDYKSPHREVFTARPRFAVERALSSPHDYLGCECCSSDQRPGLEASQPPIAILYQLYLESGSLINAADLWEAFRTIVSAEHVEDEEEENQRVLALFSRSLAELRYLDLIKSSRKKADHLAKLAWQGL